MRYTPVELRHVRLGRAVFGGYKKQDADQLLGDVADSFEEVWRDRGELSDKLEDVEARFDEVKQREALLASTLVAAQKAAAQATDAANREAEVIVAEAHQEARSIMRTAQGERERLFAEARRVEALLRAALGMAEEARGELPAAEQPEVEPSSAAALPSLQHWPRREDTREFQAVSLEPDEPEGPELPPIAEAHADDSGPWAGRDFAWG